MTVATAARTATAWYLVPPNAEMIERILHDAIARGMDRIEFRDCRDPFTITKEVDLAAAD